MESFNWNEIIQMAVNNKKNKWGVYVSNKLDLDDEKDCIIWKSVMKKIEKLYNTDTEKHYKAMRTCIFEGLILFDTEEEQKQFCNIFLEPDNTGFYICVYNAKE